MLDTRFWRLTPRRGQGCPPGKIPVPVYQANNDRVFVRCYPYHYSYPSGGRGVPCTFTLSQAAGKFVIVAGTTAREEMLWARTSTAAHRPKRFNKPHARWAGAPPAGSSAAAANRGTEPTPSATAQKTRDRVRITFVLATFKALQQLMAEWFVIACGGGRTGRGWWRGGSRICLCRRRSRWPCLRPSSPGRSARGVVPKRNRPCQRMARKLSRQRQSDARKAWAAAAGRHGRCTWPASRPPL